MSLQSLMDYDDRQHERWERAEADRIAKGLPRPVWVPPTAEELAEMQERLFGKRKKQLKKFRK